MAAARSNPPANTEQRCNTVRSSSSSRSYDHATAWRSVWWRSNPRRDPDSNRNRSPRRSRTSWALIDTIRAAANSIANAIPSRRRQISITAVASASSSNANAGFTAWARSTNNATAADADPARTSSDGTGHSCSAPTRSPSRDVAITFTVVVWAKSCSTTSAAASSTCSQLSNTNSSRRPDSAWVMLSVTESAGLGGHAQHGGHRVGHRRRVADRRQLDQPHPVGELAGQLGRDLHRQAGLAHPAHPGEGHQPMGPHLLGQLLHRDLAAHETRRLHRQVPRHRIQRPQRRELDPQPVGAHLVQVLDTRQVTQAMLAPIDQLDARHHRRRGRRHQDLAAVAGGHHPRRPVQHRTEVVLTATLGLTGGDPHAHRQPQRLLRLHRGVDRGAGRAERRAHPVTGVLEQPTPMSLDRRSQHLVMEDQGGAHRLGVGLPATRRTLDVGEQKRHRPRRRPDPHKARSYAHGSVRPARSEDRWPPAFRLDSHEPRRTALAYGPAGEEIVSSAALDRCTMGGVECAENVGKPRQTARVPGGVLRFRRSARGRQGEGET